MALIATIDGKPVYSDKRMLAIIDARVTFDDGSWCDVGTGEVHNAGAGYINIGGSDSAEGTQKVTEEPKSFDARNLVIRGIVADVSVQVHERNDIEYTITGPADQVKGVRTAVLNNTLFVESDDTGTSGGGVHIRSGRHTVIQSGRGRTVITGGDISIGGVSFGGGVTNINIGGGGVESDTNVVVKVPHGASVTSDRVQGSVYVGDTDGSLIANVQSGGVAAGRVRSAQLNVQGHGDIRVREVNGTVLAQVQGSGDIDIECGEISSLSATVQGSGDIHVDGTAETASLTVMGSGDITIAHVHQTPMKSVMGSGDIRVQRVG